MAYYLRIPFLVLSVYGIGYQQGIMDYSREPQNMESKLLDTILAGVGCVTPEDREGVMIAYEGEWRTLLARFRAHHLKVHGGEDIGYDEEYRRVVMLRNIAIVGEKIVKVAQIHVKEKLKEAVKDATCDLPPEVLENESRLYKALDGVEDVELWTRARRHMDGQWKYVLIPSSVPNAFVSEILPHRIFITTSLLQQFVETQDELALVLGHEISHLILGHSSAQNSFETSFRTIEILLLSLDPTEGLLSLAFMSFLASVRGAIGAVYSRDNERSADELGIKLTAMACYNTREASRVFHKMHLHNVESGMESSSSNVGWGGLLSIFDSHPPSDERFRSLLEESGTENPEKYEEDCASLKTLFWEAMKPGAPSPVTKDDGLQAAE
jgi:Zn-dependent protease with chaperone function